MSYHDGKSYNGELYIGHVKWSNDYKHVIAFTNENGNFSAAARTAFLKDTLTKKANNISAISSLNGYIDVLGRLSSLENANYCMFKNDSDFSDTYYCCFITDFEVKAEKTTRIYIQLDVFQQYFYSTTFYQSYIERAIVSSSANERNHNYLPEPVSAPLIRQEVLTNILTTADWSPLWVLHSASYYNSATGDYDYSGKGTENTYGEYGRFIESKVELQNMISMYGRKPLADALNQAKQQINDSNAAGLDKPFWREVIDYALGGWATAVTDFSPTDAIKALADTSSLAEFQDHRDELIGLYAIPKWLKDAYIAAGGDANYADNRRVQRDITLTINSGTLANGYTPRNKKLLTSVCRAYALCNRNGLMIPFKPELFSETPVLSLYGITMSTDGYQYHVSHYSDIRKAYGEVAYSSERRVGYDANTGLNKALSIIGAGTSVVSGVTGIASGNPAAVASGVGQISSGLVSAIDSLGSQEEHFGNNGDLLRITGGYANLLWTEFNPSVAECEAIDNFFDMYGYTIHEHAQPTNFMKTRPNWNYLKTQDINMTSPCPSRYENELKNMFNNGVTIWHNYSTFGNYGANNQ